MKKQPTGPFIALITSFNHKEFSFLASQMRIFNNSRIVGFVLKKCDAFLKTKNEEFFVAKIHLRISLSFEKDNYFEISAE